MNKQILALFGIGLLIVASIALSASLSGCSLPYSTPIPLPTLIILPSSTPVLTTVTTAVPTPTIPTPTVSLPTVTPAAPTPTTGSAPTPTTGGIIPGAPSGPYAVILVAPGDVLNIRTGPGAGYAISGSLAATATNVMRTGPSSTINGDLWVQVQNPGGGGWVNADYLTEYMAPATFCADNRVTLLLTNFGNALELSNGETLASLVSPAHGVAVRLWRNSAPLIFDREHTRWVFDSTYEHNWGAAPASGLDTVGSFHAVVLPKLLDVFNASYSLTCNSLGTATQYGSIPWPVEYTNVNFYTVFKPGTPGVDLDFRYWLVGVEYVQGQPYVFGLIHFNWEP